MVVGGWWLAVGGWGLRVELVWAGSGLTALVGSGQGTGSRQQGRKGEQNTNSPSWPGWVAGDRPGRACEALAPPPQALLLAHQALRLWHLYL